MTPVLVALVAALLAISGCGASSGAESTTDRSGISTYGVLLDFNSDASPEQVSSAGQIDVEVEVLSTGPDVAKRIAGRDSGSAFRLPSITGVENGQHAVLKVTSSGIGDPLSPGGADFVFGADFMLDPVSEGLDVDNGNNLVQRGLFSDAAQYKIQVDHGKISCRIQGTAGDAIVFDKAPVVPGTWYSVSCERRTDEVVLTVRRYDDAEATTSRTVEPATLGAVQMNDSSTPLAIGGKISTDGTLIMGDSDQFNGAIDNVYFNVVGR